MLCSRKRWKGGIFLQKYGQEQEKGFQAFTALIKACIPTTGPSDPLAAGISAGNGALMCFRGQEKYGVLF